MGVANNGRIFVSHSHDDNERCAPLLTALDAWGVDYFFDRQGLTAGQQLNAEIQRELIQCDILLRVVTSLTQASFWMSLEATAFRGLQADDQRKGRVRRVLINFVLDPIQNPDPFDAATLYIDASSRPRSQWVADLGRAIGVLGATSIRTLSRREMFGFGAAAALALGSAAAAGTVYGAYHPVSADAAIPGHSTYPGGLYWKLPNLSTKNHIPPVPSVSGATLFVMTADGLSAYDLSNVSSAGPTRMWNQHLQPHDQFSSPVQFGDTVHVTVDQAIIAFNSKTGQKIWSRSVPTDLGSLTSSPLQRGDRIFVLDAAGALHACSAQDGKHLWRVLIDQSGSLYDTTTARSTPDADDSSVYIGSDDHHVYALNASDGSTRWKFLTRGVVGSSPALVDGVVYIGSRDYYLYALDARDGSLKWKYLTGGQVESSPTVRDGVVYLASNDAYLYALDAATGSPYWRSPMGDLDSDTGSITSDGPVVSSVAVTGDCVCVEDSLKFVVRSYSRSDGTPRWTYTSKDTFQNAPPVGAHGIIYFGSGDGALYAFGA